MQMSSDARVCIAALQYVSACVVWVKIIGYKFCESLRVLREFKSFASQTQKDLGGQRKGHTYNHVNIILLMTCATYRCQ